MAELTQETVDGFDLVSMTQAINYLPDTYGRITQSGLFRFEGLTTRAVTMDIREDVVTVYDSKPWGAQGQKTEMPPDYSRSFNIPHLPVDDAVAASDVQGVRAFGTSNQLEAFTDRVNRKLVTIRRNINMTMEYRRFHALTGKIIEPNSGSLMVDFFREFGIQQRIINFDLTNPNAVVRQKCLELKRYLEDSLQGESMTNPHVFVDSAFMDLLIEHKSVRESFLYHAEASTRLGDDPRNGFRFCDVVFEEYRAHTNGKRWIQSGTGHCIPNGTVDTFAEYGAPADFAETVNTIALPMYARSKMMDYNRGMSIHVQSNVLPVVRRPKTLVVLTASLGHAMAAGYVPN